MEGAYEGALRAFRNPLLGLLHGSSAPFVVTVLALVFTAQRPQVPVAEVHAEIDAALARLRAAGYGEDGTAPLPAGVARDLCRGWVRAGWLTRQAHEGVEVYQVSAHGVAALEVAGRVGGVRTRVSQSRVRTLLDAVEGLAQDADPDVMTRIARIDAEIRERQEEVRRLERTGVVEPVPDDRLLEEAENVLHLARELPADFARVVETIVQVQRDVVTDLRQDVRPTGEVLREYLQRGRDLMESTREGRAFAGALALIGRAEHIDALAAHLRTILGHPFAAGLTASQRRELRDVARRIEQGVRDVLEAQQRASHVITTQIRTHDPLRDREVDALLREAMAGLQRWMPTSRRREPVTPVRRMPVADVAHLRQRTDDLRPAAPPAPLEPVVVGDVADDDARAWGGPHYVELERHVAGLVAGTSDRVPVAEAFTAAPEGLRRPVDLLGLLEIAHRHGMVEGDEVVTVEAVRPDGTRRRFAFGAVALAGPASAGGDDDEHDDEGARDEGRHD
ncbi:hypothetical protein Cma02nite_27780 [Cellulomonas marina]|nr:hypothetical protein Cma02nite_27780 [Cellulomonas marina]